MNDIDFERQLRASLRYGAAQAQIPDVGFDPLTVETAFEDEVRVELGAAADRTAQRRPTVPGQPRPRWVLECLAAAVVVGVIALAITLGVFGRHDDRPARPGAAPPWQVGVQLATRLDPITITPGRRFSEPAGAYVYLVVTVAPHSNGKAYLYRSIDNGAWVLLGPHNTDLTGREVLRAAVPRSGHAVAYRVYVPAADGHAANYSGPIVLTGR